MLIFTSLRYIVSMAAMIETANPAFYSASTPAIALDGAQRTWQDSTPKPFLVMPAAPSVVFEKESGFEKVLHALETASSIFWIIACALVSFVWVACFRIQPKNRGVR